MDAGSVDRSKVSAGAAGAAALAHGADDAGAGSTGAGVSDGSTGAAGDGSAGAGAVGDPAPCDLNGNCTLQCQSTVTCGIEWPGFACELQGFTGATAEVSCGQRVVIGTACCGGCGCVPVEVYFDGVQCWEGMPECTLPQFTDQLLDPHAPTIPNPSFTVPSTLAGSFYLGSGGFGGGGGAGGGSSAVESGGAATATGGTGGGSGAAGEAGD